MPIDPNLQCSEITNGKLCRIPDKSFIDAMIKKDHLVATSSKHKNGERISIETRDGAWVGSAITYGDGKYFLLKDR